MARRPRLDMAGYHHVVNRGVAKTDIFKNKKDKDKFLQILCKSCQTYDVIVHDYCLMDNHYHLLLETQKENLSLMMRQVNSNYAIYFNKKEERSGHLWQGRFKSWYIINQEYLYTLIRYIEQNPVKAGITRKTGKYPYCFASALIRKEDAIPCASQSMLIKEFDAGDLADFLNLELDDNELENLEKEKKRKITVDKEKIIQEKSLTLLDHFKSVENKTQRNSAIYSAFRDGYTQTDIANYLNLTASLISQVIKKFNI